MKQSLTVLLAATLFSLAAAAERPDLIAQAKRGEIPEAKASWWGFDAADSTDALQTAIKSGVKRLVVDNVGKPWIVRPIFLESNLTVVFEKGVVVEAKKGEFKGSNDSLFTSAIKHDIELIGDGTILRMHRADYDNPKLYKKAEWRHVLSIRSAKNVTVSGLTLALSGGDGIYLGVSKRGVTNENIVIKDVICDRNYRQGISVITARNLLIENVVMKDTGGTPPAAGIDFEPNHPSEQVVNCVMRNCVAENNHGVGYVFYLPNLHTDSAPVSVRLENCISRNGNRSDFVFITGNDKDKTVGGKVEVVDCRFEGSKGTSVSIDRKPADGAAVVFENCVVDSPALAQPGIAPIVVRSQAGNRRSVGGVDFGNMTVIDPVERPVFGYEDWIGGTGVESLKGTFLIKRGGKEETIVLTKAWLSKAFPPRSYKQVPPLDLTGKTLVPAMRVPNVPVARNDYYLRKAGTYAVYAKQGETVALRVKHTQVGKYGGKPLKVVAIAPSGKKVNAGAVPFQAAGEVSFVASETGVYRLPLKCGANRMAITGVSHPVVVSSENSAIGFIGAAGDLYFLVPAGTKEFGVFIYGQGAGEAIKATVFDPTGKQVWEKDNITLPEMCAPEQAPPAEDQVWRLRLTKPSGTTYEDNFVDLRGIPPFLARDPRALLTISK